MAIDYLPDSSETTKTNITENRAGIALDRVFTVDAMPLKVPETLRTLDPDTPVWARFTWVRRNINANFSASTLIEIFEEIIKRQHDGFFTVNEAAQALEDLYPDIEAQSMLDQLLNAELNGCSIIRGSDKLYLLKNQRASAVKSLVKASDVNGWFESQGVNYRMPNTETGQQDSQVKITSNHIQFPSGIEFVAFGDLADFLANAQCFGEVEETDLNEVFSRLKHGEALLSAAQNGDLPIKDKSTKTIVTLGSLQLHKNRIDKSTCVAVADFQTYAKTLGVNVSVAELNDVLQKIEIQTDIEPTQSSVAKSVKRTKATTWRDVAWTYVIATYQAGQYATAKDLFKKLENTAGLGNSPFKKGEGALRGSLFIEQISSPVAPKTLANAWKKIRESPHS